MPEKQQPLAIFQSLRKDAFDALEEAPDFASICRVEADYLGKNGRLTHILKSLKEMPEQERKIMGSAANVLKKELEEKIKLKKAEMRKQPFVKHANNFVDITIPGKKISRGHLHPITRVLREVAEIFESMGFEIVEGPEVETEYYNFDALNIPKNHPARDMWDTLWLKPLENRMLLRAHTSPMEIRYMEKNNPPLRIIAPGRCFRYEATDATHEFQFYQVEGLMVGEKINFSHLKGVLEVFLKRLFKNQEIEIRFIPAYYPFVEPGIQVDFRMNKKGKWLEIAGAGMTHPQVFKNVKLNPKSWQGFAFGIGLDRIAMLKYKIDDIRLFHSGDLRFIKQF